MEHDGEEPSCRPLGPELGSETKLGWPESPGWGLDQGLGLETGGVLSTEEGSLCTVCLC